MLKGIPTIISPELMKTLMEMGHGDEILLADANFPAVTCAKRLIRCDGHKIPPLLQAILQFFPFDHTVESPVALMGLATGQVAPDLWQEYRQIVSAADPGASNFEFVERFAYYERAKNAFAVVITGDFTFKANILLKKGIINNLTA